jgi:lactate 2-monooxygenase
VGFNTFQYELYFAGMGGQVPTCRSPTTGCGSAREVLDAKAFAYVEGSAGAERTAAANRDAFGRWRFVPRMLTDVAERDLSVDLLGRTVPAPLLCGPVGVQSIVHPEGEKAVARGAASLGLPFVLSTVSSFPLEEVAEEAGDGPRWFQLYWPSEDAVTDSLVQRAADAGYEAVVVTLDTRLLAWRPRDLATAYLPFLHAEGLANYLTDPAFRAGLPEPNEGMDETQAAVMRWISVFSDPGQTWDDLRGSASGRRCRCWSRASSTPTTHGSPSTRAWPGWWSPTTAAGRSTTRSGRSRRCPAWSTRWAARCRCCSTAGCAAARTRGRAGARGAGGADRPAVGVGAGARRRGGVRHVLRCLLADLDLTMALSGLRSLDELTRDVLAPAPS